MESKALVPVQQALVPFHEHNILSIRLPDDRVAASHIALCRMLDLNRVGQIQRIRRDEELSEQLVLARVETTRGPRPMEVLIVEAIPRWVLGINFNLLAPEKRPLLIALKVEAVKVFYGYFFKTDGGQTAQPATKILPEPDDAPGEWVEARPPSSSLPDDVWERLYQVLVGFEQDWQTMKADIAALKASQQKRAGTAGPAPQRARTLSMDHMIQLMVLAETMRSQTGEPIKAIYAALSKAMGVEEVNDIHDADWQTVISWLWQRGQQSAPPA